MGIKKESDAENFIAAAIPGGIEAQEARGQTAFVESDALPIESRNAAVLSAEKNREKRFRYIPVFIGEKIMRNAPRIIRAHRISDSDIDNSMDIK